MKTIFNIINFVLILLLCSCVGTVEDVNPNRTKGSAAGKGRIAFDGIYDARAIAHDKVEIFFYPSLLAVTDVTYIISYDGLTVEKTVPGANLRPDYRGLLKYTVSGLDINTEYAFSVQAKNSDGLISTSTLIKRAKTFANKTANFVGIGEVKNLPGFDGRTALRVEWPAAERQGTITPKDEDVIQYEIILLDSDVATPVAFDDLSFVEPFRKVVYVDGTKISHQVNGLQPDTKYFIRVRGVHKGMSTNGDDPSYKAEQNSNYILMGTLSDDMSTIDVDTSSFSVEIPRSVEGKYSLNTSWASAKGSFDHYRLYYKQSTAGTPWAAYKSARDTVCSGKETNDTSWSCVEIGFEKDRYTISDLVPFTNYDVYLLVCGTKTCAIGDAIEFSSTPPYKTNPGHAKFNGIYAIENAKYYWALNEIYLRLTPPDINSGVVDGVLVELKERVSGPLSDVFLNHPDYGSGLNLSVANFDYKIADEIIVSGVSLSESEPYCFSLIPYYYSEGNLIENRNNETTSCILPRVKTPTQDEFPGLTNAVVDSSTNTLTLAWAAPLGGVYQGFAIFLKIGGGPFLYSEGINSDPNYIRINVPFGYTSHQIPFMNNGDYQVGILAYYNDGSTETFSEPNINVQPFTVGP